MNINTKTAGFAIPCILGLLTFNSSVFAQSSTESQNVSDPKTDQTSEVQSQAPSTTVTDDKNAPLPEESGLTAETAPATAPASADSEDADIEAESSSSSEADSTATQEISEQPTAPESKPQFRKQPPKISASLPTSTAVVIRVCQPIRFDSKQKDPFPVTAVLAHPISDTSGSVIAPMRSLANLQIHPKGRMVEMQVNSVIVDGRLVPLQTSPVAIPVLSRLHPDSQNAFFDSDVSTEGVALNVVNNLQGWISDQGLISSGVSDILGVGLSVASGITSAANSPRNEKISELPRGVSLIFALASPVRLSKSQSADFEEPAGADPCSQAINGGSDYSDDGFSDDGFSDSSSFEDNQF